ncbi:MAG: alkane 1-monooxygenase [Flavobacteriales bacterium]|nr:alkane 1-monooxygenase [Flavobacteriales bacterium]
MKKLKYLSILALPLTVFISFNNSGVLTFLPVFVFFGLVPLLEMAFQPDAKNLDERERELAANDNYYDFLLYLMLPIQWGFLIYFFFIISGSTTTLDLVGKTVSMGIMCGVIGINLGHELGHRLNKVEQLIGEILLLSSLENHFLPYHNRGHHHNVGTPNDPATARKNELLFVFWFRSQIGSYLQAWQIEKERLSIQKLTFFHYTNRMIIYTFLHITLLSSIYFIFGLKVLLAFLLAAIIGILLLETVNYIEHYGLVRQQKENGTYERVRRWHSWNSNHVLGRIVLFELSRHSDHHYKADRPYQLLESHEESPTMPTGYPGMMLMALVPPLFFKVMNNRVEAARNTI